MAGLLQHCPVNTKTSVNLAMRGEATSRTQERKIAEAPLLAVLIVVGWTSIVMRTARTSGGGMENWEEVVARAKYDVRRERAAMSARSMCIK